MSGKVCIGAESSVMQLEIELVLDLQPVKHLPENTEHQLKPKNR
jgi:hypothetical protein